MPERDQEEIRVREARAAVAADAAELAGIVREIWDVEPDPFGDRLLLPRREAVEAGEAPADPLPVSAIPWEVVLARFRARHGRPPAPGARPLAGRELSGARRPE